MSLFEYQDFRLFLKDHLLKRPKRGRGEIGKIAQHLGVHSTYLSLVLNNSRHLSQEQAFDLAQYLQLTDLETEYFCLLVQMDRAGNKRFEKHLREKLDRLKNDSRQLSRRFEHDRKLTDQERAIFYSSWFYSAVRLFTSTVDRGVRLEEIVARFDLPRSKIVEAADFLVSAGLLNLEKELYRMGPQRTFLEKGSPHLSKHHANWRIKALQRSDVLSDDEMMFTSPISISKHDFALIREELASWLKKFSQTVSDSPAEEVACLNIDFFWV